MTQSAIRQRLEQAFEPQQAQVLAEVIEAAYTNLVKTSDFSELKAIVRDLAQAQTRTEQRVEELAQAQGRTEERVSRLEAVVEKLAEAQARTEQELRALTQVVGNLRDTQAAMKGDLLEIRYRERAAAYLGKILRRVKVLDTAALEAEFETRLPEAEYLDVLLADLVVRGQLRQPPETPLWLVIEVSAVVDRNDVERAARRAAYVRQATGTAAALVAGQDITQSAAALARENHAAVLLDGGQLEGWDEALAYASSH